MATEAEYDEIIAPMLAEVGRKCEQLGMSIVARVEWDGYDAGITAANVSRDRSVAQQLTHIAALTRGNIDALCIEAVKRFDCSQSVVLHQFAKPHSATDSPR